MFVRWYLTAGSIFMAIVHVQMDVWFQVSIKKVYWIDGIKEMIGVELHCIEIDKIQSEKSMPMC